MRESVLKRGHTKQTMTALLHRCGKAKNRTEERKDVLNWNGDVRLAEMRREEWRKRRERWEQRFNAREEEELRQTKPELFEKVHCKYYKDVIKKRQERKEHRTEKAHKRYETKLEELLAYYNIEY